MAWLWKDPHLTRRSHWTDHRFGREDSPELVSPNAAGGIRPSGSGQRSCVVPAFAPDVFWKAAASWVEIAGLDSRDPRAGRPVAGRKGAVAAFAPARTQGDAYKPPRGADYPDEELCSPSSTRALRSMAARRCQDKVYQRIRSPAEVLLPGVSDEAQLACGDSDCRKRMLTPMVMRTIASGTSARGTLGQNRRHVDSTRHHAVSRDLRRSAGCARDCVQHCPRIGRSPISWDFEAGQSAVGDIFLQLVGRSHPTRRHGSRIAPGARPKLAEKPPARPERIAGGWIGTT